MQWLLLTLSLATAVQCHILANGDSLEVLTVLGGAVTVKLEYPPVGPPIPNCCSNAAVLQQPVLAGALVTEVADLRDLGYLLRLDFVENIVTCHLIPDVGEEDDLSSTLCPHLVCPAGWNLLWGTCFLVTQVSGSWAEGQTFCQQRGGELATISSDLQQAALSDMLTDDTWIGLRHQHDNHTYTWIDGSEHIYTSWTQKEPSISETRDLKECVEMHQRHNFMWNAAHCNEAKQYLCSVPGTAITAARGRNSPPAMTTPTASPTTTVMTTTPAPECEDSWSEYRSSCYKIFKKNRTYREATASCSGFGANLARIDSEDENVFVFNLKRSVVANDISIGLSDEQTEGVFIWQDNYPYNYSRFHSSEPTGGRSENCVVMSSNSYWYDVMCGGIRHYICEKSIQ